MFLFALTSCGTKTEQPEGPGFIPNSNAAPINGTASAKLAIGSKAPPLKVSRWYQGTEVEVFEPGKFYLIEFWATWCAPCRAGMPELSKLQETHQDKLQIVGVTKEDLGTVGKFMRSVHALDAKWEDVIKYTIAIDYKEETWDAYMTSAGLSSIPNSFLVGQDGTIQWIGNPAGVEEVLEQVLEGSWQGRLEIDKFARQENWPSTMQAIDKQLEKFPENLYALGSRLEVLKKLDRIDELRAERKKMSNEHWDKAEHLKRIVLDIIRVNEDGEDLELARKSALRAYELTDRKNPYMSSALAEVYFFGGEIQKAIEQERKTLEFLNAPEFRNEFSPEGFQAVIRGVKGVIKKYEVELAKQN